MSDELSKCTPPPNSYYTLPFENDPAWKLGNGNWDDPFHGHGKGEWKGLPANLDAALMWNNPRVAFFFKGSQYWAYNPGIGMYAGYPKSIAEKWHGIPDNLDGAIMWNNGIPFFFKGDQYWAYDPDPQNEHIIKQASIAGNWHGIEANLDAAIMWNNDKAYFFKGDQYWAYDPDPQKEGILWKGSIKAQWHGLQGPLKAPIFWNKDTVYFFQKGGNWYWDYNPDPKEEGIRSRGLITDDPTQQQQQQSYAFDFVHDANNDGKGDTRQTVRAARGGKVYAWIESQSGNSWGKGSPVGYTGVGNFLVIQHLDGTFGTYWHLDKNGISNSPFYKNKGRGPRSGDQITRGDRIAISGNTGNASGPHLHFDVRTGWDVKFGVTITSTGNPASAGGKESDSIRIRFSDLGRGCWIPVTGHYLDHVKCNELRRKKAGLEEAGKDTATVDQQMAAYHCQLGPGGSFGPG